MTTDTITCAIIGHLVGDYLMQNDWMANNKKKAWQPCAIHCLLWTIAVMFFAGWFTRYNSIFIFLVLFWTHYLQDRTNIIRWWMTLPWKDQSQFMECYYFEPDTMRFVPGLGPWSIIVVDNVWHIVTLWAVWKWIA